MIVLDTQVVAWLAARPERLSRPARQAIQRHSRAAGLAIASVTLMELAQLAASGVIAIPGSPTAWLRELLAESRLAVKPLTAEVAAIAAHLPPNFPADPFDRLIAATALVERLSLVTSDERIRKSRVVETIW